MLSIVVAKETSASSAGAGEEALAEGADEPVEYGPTEVAHQFEHLEHLDVPAGGPSPRRWELKSVRPPEERSDMLEPLPIQGGLE